MMQAQSLDWIDPLTLARQVNETHWVLCYSSSRTRYSGRYSYLAHGLQESISGDDFSAFEARLTHTVAKWDHSWFGYMAYDLKHSIEALPADRPAQYQLPALHMMRFAHIYVFDHEQHALTLWSHTAPAPLTPYEYSGTIPAVQDLRSNMTKADYLEKVDQITSHIQAGNLYQANLTRKFFGKFEQPPSAQDSFAMFERLCQINPAPYSAFMQLGDSAIISSSPEMFLAIDEEGHMTSHPIKGTAKRYADPAEDKRSLQALASSLKDRAENLMIVDLMRNDFARSAQVSSVHTGPLCDITSHANVHHMSTPIYGQKNPTRTTLDAVKDCFPPGSMTGAPKIAAIRLCSELEQDARGIYSGALGWFGGDGSCHLSVVIRTLIIQNDYYEFQVGGGIVADSDPLLEWQETLIKAQSVAQLLNIPLEKLEKI